MEQPLLRVSGLCYSAGGERLLESVSFNVAQGETLAVIGPNGAGKSLLLRLCHGLLQPERGDIQWAHATRHAMVLQNPVMLRRSARANIIHALEAGGMGGDSRAKAQAALARFGLGALAERPARLLSGGEQQRLAIARAAALAPALLFLDEPTAELDPGATRQIEAMLATLKAEGVTLLITTHDLGQAKRLADRVLFLNKGRVVEAGAAQAFFTAPQTPEARAFLSGDLLW